MTAAVVAVEGGEGWRRRAGSWPVLLGTAAGFGTVQLILLRAAAAGGASLAESLQSALRVGVFCQAALLVVLAPALAITAFGRERRQATLDLLFLSHWRSAAIVAAKTVVPLLRSVALVVASGLVLWPAALAVGGGGAVARLAAAQAQLVGLAAALVAVGLLCSILLRSRSSAAAVAYLLVLTAAAGPVLIGPWIERLPDAEGLINQTLLASPITALAATLDLDVMRTERVYRLSPVGQRRFRYPAPGAVLLFYALVVSLCFAAAACSFARQRRGFRI